jgi:hypothetical protein
MCTHFLMGEAFFASGDREGDGEIMGLSYIDKLTGCEMEQSSSNSCLLVVLVISGVNISAFIIRHG